MATKKADTRYIEGIVRRKTASARVRITPADKTTITVNGKDVKDYFAHQAYLNRINEVLETPEAGVEHYDISVHVHGSGLAAQADAIRLGVARALVKEKAERRTVLKKEGYLMRDQRSVERKKFGLRKARKRPAWSKR